MSDNHWYRVIVDGKTEGGIFKEIPEMYPDDWTIGVKYSLCNTVTSLERCKQIAIEEAKELKMGEVIFEKVEEKESGKCELDGFVLIE